MHFSIRHLRQMLFPVLRNRRQNALLLVYCIAPNALWCRDRAAGAGLPEKHMSEVVRARYTGGEELANTLTHAFGLVLSIAGLTALIAVATLHGGVREIASCAIYGTTLIVMYTISTLYHSIPLAEPKRILRILDHLAIFLLIAGTYTPFMLIALRGTWGWTLFCIVWSLAALGVAIELSQLRRFR